MNPVPVGPSTVALIIGALSAAAAFVVAWAETGSAPGWLAGLAAGLTALMAVLRSWQAVRSDSSVADDLVVDDPPEVPKDYAG
jgi:hypothetical protein